MFGRPFRKLAFLSDRVADLIGRIGTICQARLAALRTEAEAERADRSSPG